MTTLSATIHRLCQANIHHWPPKDRRRLCGEKPPRGTYAALDRAAAVYDSRAESRSWLRQRDQQQHTQRQQTAESCALQAYRRCQYRSCNSRWVQDTHSIAVHAVEHARSATVSSSTGNGWSANGKWRATTSHHSIRVPLWWPVLEQRGIGVVDGLLTLWARRIPGEQDAFWALWVEQSRGTSLRSAGGYIARSSAAAPWAHGSTLDGARRVSRQRLRDQQLVTVREGATSGIIGRSLSTTLRLSDALQSAERGRLGACAAGIRSWCHTALPGRKSATVAEILAAAERHRAPVSVRLIVCRLLEQQSQQQPGEVAA